MTLCVTYKTSRSRAVSLSDSLLTTTIKKDDSGSFLPSDQEVVHQTPHAVKVQIITQEESTYGERFDVVCSIAGNVSLGLQSILHLDAYLKGTSNLWYDHIKIIIDETIYPFWAMARDQSLEICFALNDHKGRVHFFELSGGKDDFNFYEVEEENEILLSVIGDDSHNVRSEILSKVNILLYQMDFEQAIHQASVKILKDRIESPTVRFVGGGMQGAILDHHLAKYMVIKDNRFHFRGAELEDWENLAYPIMDLRSSGLKIENV